MIPKNVASLSDAEDEEKIGIYADSTTNIINQLNLN